jgi:methionyl-tRNA formyltransferase
LETGVSIMVLDVGMDTGPVIATDTTAIGDRDTTDDLEERLAALGGDLLVRAISPYLSGDATPVEQDHERATYCRPVTKIDGLIDWSDSAESIERHVRAMHSWPGAWTRWSGRRLVVRRAHVVQGHVDDANGAPGQVIGDGRQMYVVTGSGALALDEVQLEGRGLTPIRAFAHGYPGFAGSVLSSG